MGNIYDGAFRTILNDCRQLILPVINEIFGEDYTGGEEIRFFPNEHFLDQQDEADKERILRFTENPRKNTTLSVKAACRTAKSQSGSLNMMRR